MGIRPSCEMSSDSPKCGALMGVVSFGEPSQLTTIIQRPLPNGLLRAVRLPNGRIRAQILNSDSETCKIVWDVVSRPIRVSSSTMFVLAIDWSETGLQITINRERVADTDWPSTPCEPYVVEQLRNSVKAEDLSERNEAALQKRRQLLFSQRQWQNRKAMGAEFDFDRLNKEVRALVDFLALVARGAAYHDLSIAKSLRTLLIPVKGQMGLLQRCAAHIEAPLIVYTSPTPSSRVPISVDFALVVAVGGVAFGPFLNPVDVDVWLGLPSARVHERQYSNGDLIATIGNTRVAHADPGLEPLVEALEVTRIGGRGDAEKNMLADTVTRMGRAMSLAGRAILMKTYKAA